MRKFVYEAGKSNCARFFCPILTRTNDNQIANHYASVYDRQAFILKPLQRYIQFPYKPQAQLTQLRSLVEPGKVIVIYGPRRVGKTTLIQRYFHQYDRNALVVTGEDINVRDYLESQSVSKLKNFVDTRRTLIVDEAQ